MTQKTKQIGFISALVISVGSTIGAGIFFKNGSIFSNADGKLPFMIASWVVAAIGILAIAMALIELASASKGNGITEYTTRFTKKKFAKFSSAYMVLVYLPLNYFAMPLYAAMSLQDAMQAGDPNITMNGWAIFGIAFAFFVWFATVGYFQKKWAIKSQWIYTIVKFIPLIIIPIMAAVHAGQNGVSTQLSLPNEKLPTGLTAISPWMGIMASIPAILFAYDGFYTVTSMKSELKDEKKMGMVTAISLAIITSAYLFFGILTGIDGAGSIFEVSNIPNWLLITFNVMIMFAVFGIINGFGLATPEIYYQTYNENPVGIINITKKLFKIKDNKLACFVTSVALTIIFMIILIPIGIYGINNSGYSYYGSSAGLYTIADYVTNYTSLMAFIFIGGAILGALINRKRNFVQVTKYKYFVPAACVAIIFLAIAAIYMVANNIAGMTGFKGADSPTEIIKFSIMVGTLVLSSIPLLVDLFKNKNSKIVKTN